MPTTLDLKPSHAPIKKYLEELASHDQMSITHELAVKQPFYALLHTCTRKMGERWNLIAEKRVRGTKGKDVCPDATVIGEGLVRGYWEAKDSGDSIKAEAKKKFDKGYPNDNILFQSPTELLLYQNNNPVFTGDGQNPEHIAHALKLFFEYSRPDVREWDKAVQEFKKEIPALAKALSKAIEKERLTNGRFVQAFDSFHDLCRQAINPHLDVLAVEGMLSQHLLTERIFRKIFDDPDFVKRNVIAAEIERVVAALTFNKDQFLRPYEYFYKAIERNVESAGSYEEKQTLLNDIYERFFQGWSIKEADTHGIVYTPQPIVEFMVRSIEEVLKTRFDSSLSDQHVQILDPFVGTGNFMVRIMNLISPISLRSKYAQALHCNEVMLMPYYIACMNIEHAYHEATKEYSPFPGICLVDTFELAEPSLLPFGAENAQRIDAQKRAEIFVVLGNPPYNAGQREENDNNKNRTYETVDKWVADTYAKASSASLKAKYRDPYIRAMRWATNRLKDSGVVAFITNNSFVHDNVYDGVRKHLIRDFEEIYVLDLGGNAVKNPKLSGTSHNVFGIPRGVSINLFIRKNHKLGNTGSVYYARLDEYWRKEQKLKFLAESESLKNVRFEELSPNDKGTWLTEGLEDSFARHIAIGTQDAKKKGRIAQDTVFGTYSLGISTNRDRIVYSFQSSCVKQNAFDATERFNAEIDRFIREGEPDDVDSFAGRSPHYVKWSHFLKQHLRKKEKLKAKDLKVRRVAYRPFVAQWLTYHDILVDAPGLQEKFFPSDDHSNLCISVSDKGHRAPFSSLMVSELSDLHLAASEDGFQTFPFWIYEKGEARENITDWALEQFRSHYKDKKITKWDIFYYTYGVLHDREYRERYAANLKRELPRIPYAPDFHAYAKAGKRLAEIHIDYEKQKPFKLKEVTKKPFTWRVEKMRLSKDKKTLTYNECLTLTDIPPQVYEYRLGNRSALEWVVDQYQVSTDKRSGIVNDPNREDDPEYIYNLIRKVVTVSLETVSIVKGLPGLGLPEAEKAASVQ